jgi:uncharacterized membrane protein YkvA (DUF1232 family)
MAMTRPGVLRTLLGALRIAVRPGSPSLVERLRAVPRLVGATARGRYHGTTVGRLVLVAVGVAYVVSPVDLVPEALLGLFGLADDAVVASWVVAALVTETEAFLAWEQSEGSHDRPAGTGGRSDREARHETVQGHVVR